MLIEEVEEGTFDLVLTRPADAQLLLSISNFMVWRLADVVLGLTVIGNGAGRPVVRGACCVGKPPQTPAK